jgi:N-Acetylglucosaminyltransferase-IV (GnT-IV) conserved region
VVMWRKMRPRDLKYGLKTFLPAIILTFAFVTFTTQVYVLQQVIPDDSRIEKRVNAHNLKKIERKTSLSWENYAYNRTRFLASIHSWRSRLGRRQLHCLVLIPLRSFSSISFKEDLFATMRSALSSKTAQVVIHVRKRDVEVISLISSTFSMYLANEQLILLTSEYQPSIFDNDNSTYNLRDGLELGYMLDLSHQSGSNFSMILWPGWQLRNFSSFDYVTDSIQHYQQIGKTRMSSNDFNRTCWTVLSDVGIKRGDDVLLIDTAEHASRLVKFLRSTLPYNRKTFSELFDIYCKHFIWSGNAIAGPSLFELPASSSLTPIAPNPSHEGIPFLDESKFGAPPWIDHAPTFGPHISNTDPPYLIAFGVNAMIRPVVNTTYLEQFLDSLLNILTTTFILPSPANVEGNNRCSAIIVVLISSNTLEEIKQLRAFVETKYADAIEHHFLRLVDSPLETFIPLLEKRRSTYNESSGRRHWRSKQNLDVGAVLQAASGLSEYVMLLEDDTGFQPKFAEKLMSTLLEDKTSSTISWSETDFGFGYSGILIRAMDARVYQQLHQTFFDEMPCDLLGIWRTVQNGKRVYVYSPISLRYKKRLYLKHLGKQSSLVGKIQNVW